MAIGTVPTTEAICVGQPVDWNDEPGTGECRSTGLIGEPKWVCVTDHPVENCTP